VQDLGEEECYYIGRHFEQKLIAVKASSVPWIKHLVVYAEALHRMYYDHVEGKLDINQESVSHICAALFYFTNPHDIIPDHMPGKGYLDDALVINKCLRVLETRSPGVVEVYIKRVQNSDATD